MNGNALDLAEQILPQYRMDKNNAQDFSTLETEIKRTRPETDALFCEGKSKIPGIPEASQNNLLQICIPNTKRDYYTYRANDIIPPLGARVLVPFHAKPKVGIVIGLETTTHLEPRKIKNLIEIIDEKPLIDHTLRQLYHFVAHYYQAPLADVLRLALPKQFREGKHIRLHDATPSVVRILEQPLVLNAAQNNAVETIKSRLHHYHCFLLDGITGSGKTEVYLQVMESVLLQGQQVLFLVPEIGLTPQLLARFKHRFDVPMAVIHSHITEQKRQLAWTQACFNQAKLVIGTRTAVFTAMPHLGLIVIDEEHDTSLKQMEGVRYSARDTALMRAHQANIPIILGSATPSLESFYNAEQKKYTRILLPYKAESTHPLHITITDLRGTPMQHGLAQSTLRRIGEHVNNNQQVLVFINRRGFSPILLCHQCGWMCDCPACDAHLTLHRQDVRMICHHCGLSCQKPRVCTHCGSPELIPVGTGTQRLHEFLQQAFPERTVIRIDRDEVKGKLTLEKHLKSIHDGEAHIIVGTQMMAKGHHFPRLTLVVIVDVDNGFYNQDFRALERLGQLITQVAGRAGRAELPGELIIQTHIPDQSLLNLLLQQGYHPFAQTLLRERTMAMLPPVHFAALIRAEDKKPERVHAFMQAIKAFFDKTCLSTEFQTQGPAPAPMQRKAHFYRMQLLCKAKNRKILQSALTKLRLWLTMEKMANHLRWHIDVDPVDLS